MKALNTDKLNRSFGFVMGAGLTGLALLRGLVTGLWAWWLLGLGAGFLAAALGFPRALGPLRVVWMKLAMVLGAVNQRVILTLLFALLITPFALALRLLGKQPIHLRPDPAASSYWRPRRREEFTADRMERQF